MIVIGTAGHIDHGKSAIVKRLTGSDPDRLPEEKARGMTIDLGFAFYRTPAGEDLALVDVPGHERFVKNMIAGAGGIDAVMLVIAADDGWMPQSQEHFQITKLLGVRTGLIVINKIDLAEPDWIGLLEDDIRQRVAGSFLADAPVVRVSAETGEGFEALTRLLDALPTQIESRKDRGKARLYIDRSFIRPGIGGVVTGTLRGGAFSVGQSVLVWPAMVTAKIRTLQSRNEEVAAVMPGQRTAVSFTGIDREKLVRGGVITDRTDARFFLEHPVLALSLEVLPESPVALSDRRHVVVIVGTSETEGEIRIFEQRQVKPGQRGIVFLKPDSPLHTLVGDRYVMRLPTPMVTVGGGTVLDHLEKFPRRKELAAYGYLRKRVEGSLPDLVVSELEKRCLAESRHLLGEADLSPDEIRENVARLTKDGVLGHFREYVYHRDLLDRAVAELKAGIDRELEANPHLKGLPMDRIKGLSSHPMPVLEVIVRYMVESGLLVLVGDEFNPAGRTMALKGVIKQAYDEIMAALAGNPYAPPSLAELASAGKIYQHAIKYILDTREGHKCGSEFVFLTGVWEETVQFIRERLKQQDKLTVAELRDRFGYTRKYAIPILEETDRLGVTRRDGDVRIKGDG
ncbi:MAG TPA: selenocysteine-specific translation elongation factor [Acidobacteriota bacterium]|nr:selenocysteine-specific translation elongation factor [Acidobacteriota bacterium]